MILKYQYKLSNPIYLSTVWILEAYGDQIPLGKHDLPRDVAYKKKAYNQTNNLKGLLIAVWHSLKENNHMFFFTFKMNFLRIFLQEAIFS